MNIIIKSKEPASSLLEKILPVMVINHKKKVASRSPRRDTGRLIYHGHVKWFNLGKGYGFIQRNDGRGDCFVHYSGVARPFYYIYPGETVEFEIEQTRKGLRAVNVRGIKNEALPNLFREVMYAR